jgi:hypothetical protein
VDATELLSQMLQERERRKNGKKKKKMTFSLFALLM